jgi:hypothetical protein
VGDGGGRCGPAVELSNDGGTAQDGAARHNSLAVRALGRRLREHEVAL